MLKVQEEAVYRNREGLGQNICRIQKDVKELLADISKEVDYDMVANFREDEEITKMFIAAWKIGAREMGSGVRTCLEFEDEMEIKRW